MTQRYVCIHGHFYQPPRENPWVEAVGIEESARPHRNWNERIAAECYAPNAAAPILDENGQVGRTINNYARISFNVGPTLFTWLEEEAPQTYRAILDADRKSRTRYSGHGSAIAQAYNHMILPLANRRDKRTQVIWGIRDFERRFGRPPEGMWLPETAVDLETLAVLAEAGIRFTILAPHQARRLRTAGSRDWQQIGPGGIEPRAAYRHPLPAGRSIALFFYDAAISNAISFEALLRSGDALAGRLLSGFVDDVGGAQLVHVATDGETYGHHHRHGEMALAYALERIEASGYARLTNYGEFLERHPPVHEVEIRENTSWSCVHGIERWRSDCGCHTGGQRAWKQAWRAPLRQSLDWLRDTLAHRYEAEASTLLQDPWVARDDYIAVILDRSPESVRRFFAEHAARPLDEAQQVRALKLLEMQRHAMLMYTSCGWFFHDLAGIETLQVLEYAARAVELADELFGPGIEAGLTERLAKAHSNRKERGDGRRIYLELVKPVAVDAARVAGHYAVGCLVQPCPERTKIYAYAVERLDHELLRAKTADLLVGAVRVTSRLTLESRALSFAVLDLRDGRLAGGIRDYPGDRAHEATARELAQAFQNRDYASIVRLLQRDFPDSRGALRPLSVRELSKEPAPP
ncbi:MAG: DUF3536 domain-containing protein [Gemmatimonadetes bacterium]|nr:DUF3536 domain-containing protein [Gemmatimonadota bacterium]